MTTIDVETPPAAEPPQPIKGWMVIATPLLGAVLFALIVAAGVLILAFHSGHFDTSALRSLLKLLRNNYFVAMTVSDAFYLFILFSAWLLLPKAGPASLASYFPAVSLKWILIGIGGGVVMAMLVGPVLIGASQVFHFAMQPTPGEEMLVPKTGAQLIAVLLAGAVFAPVVEETYFRGLLLRWLRKRASLWLAAGIDALLFALVHGRFISHPGIEGVVVTAALFVPGIALAWLAIRSKSLWPGIVAHGTYNGLLLSLAFVAPNMS